MMITITLIILRKQYHNNTNNTKHSTPAEAPGALRYLHGLVPSVAHGDLKPSNVLVLERSSTSKKTKSES